MTTSQIAKLYRSPLPRSVNEFDLRLSLQSTEHYNFTRSVPGVLLPHVESLVSGRCEGVAIVSRVPQGLHQAISEAVTAAVKTYYSSR